jgi:hypothetical protein
MKQGDPGYWEWRKNVGRPKAIRSPKEMWKLACGYFESIDGRPFMKQEQRKSPIKIEKGAIIDDDLREEIKNPVIGLETIRPYTWAGFEAYLFERGVLANLDHYKCNLENRYQEFIEIIRAIDKIMFAQKFEGAASGAFNANIIARDLGLTDKSELRVTEEQPLFGDEPED